MRTIPIRQWLTDIGLSQEIIPCNTTYDRLSKAGQQYIRQPHVVNTIISANNYRIRKGEYIYLTDTAQYHSVTLID